MDDLDRAIVATLTKRGRATYAEVGGVVGLSAPAVKRRVDRLVSDGVIAGFTAVVDPAALGWGIEALVEVYCQGRIAPSVLREAWEPVRGGPSSHRRGFGRCHSAGARTRRSAPGEHPGAHSAVGRYRTDRLHRGAIPADRSQLSRLVRHRCTRSRRSAAATTRAGRSDRPSWDGVASCRR